jgi:hypothetical protein
VPSRFKAFAAVVALVAASLAVGVAHPAAAGTPLAPGFGAIAVDDVHDHVFVSSPTANVVTVLDFDGAIVRTINDLAGAGAMVVDGSTLYVVLSGRGTVDAYDTTTFDRIGRWGAGTLVKPGPLAIAGGKLWTSSGECAQWTTKLASIDLGGTHAVQTYDAPGQLAYCPGLASGPHDTDQLLAYGVGLSTGDVYRLDVSSGAPVLAAGRNTNMSYIAQMAVTPDGTRFELAAGSPYEIDEYRTSDLLPDGLVYPTGGYPNAVTVTGARGGLLAAGRDGAYDPDIDVFELSEPAHRVFSYDFGGTNNTLKRAGLAFSGDGRLLFAVSGSFYNGSSEFNVFDLTAPPPAPTTTSTTTTTRPTTTTTSPSGGPIGPPTTTTTTRPSTPPPTVPVTTTTTSPSHPVDGGAGQLGDARNDTTDFDGVPIFEPKADIISAGAVAQNGRIVLTMQTAQPSSPVNDRNWADGSSYAAWALDTNWDGEPDRLAILATFSGVLRGAVTDLSDPPQLICEAAPSYTNGVLSLSVEPSCVGGASFSWSAFIMYNQGGPGVDGPYALDFAPDELLGGELTDPDPTAGTAAAPGTDGYWLLGAGGDVYPFGAAGQYGNQSTAAADIEPTPTGSGYWILGRDGRVYGKGDAKPLGDALLAAGEQAVSLSVTPSGRGYWVFTDRGRVFNFGDAPHRGDMSGRVLNGPVLGSVATPSGQGYWMVASDGGIFAFGDAGFSGSMGGRKLNKPVMSMAPDPDGSGYWLVASDGGIFAFDAPFYGSTGHLHLNKPISGMVPGRAGYLMVAEDGGTFAFGDVAFHGSLGGNPPARPIVAVALSPER